MKKGNKIITLRLIIINVVKKLFGIHQNQTLSIDSYLRNLRLKYGPYLWRKKFSVVELIDVMRSFGMKKGSNVFIHCNWGEFYNFDGTPKELIDGILDVIGKEGTLIMPAYPFLKKNKIFNVKKSVTAAGLLAEEFRHYPGVKRSINVQHSVCAFGPMSDYLVSEHHMSETCWDEKSPYFKMADIDTLVFAFGLGKYYLGTIVHCVESVLRKSIPYFHDFFENSKTTHQYIDTCGNIKEYDCYELKQNIRRKNKFKAGEIFCKKYFEESYHIYTKISNLTICVTMASKVIPKMIELGRHGIIYYKKPSKSGYSFYK